jgi:radical SAM superfamily enzyme YgiQ (UPF0313 family)
MSRILLVKLPEPMKPTQKTAYMPPLGLWSIEHNVGRWLGAEVSTIDCHLEGGDLSALEKALTYYPDVVGLSAQFSIQHDFYTQAALLCKTRGVRVVLAGGFHASAVPAPMGVDRVIQGEGETGMYPIRGFESVDYPPPSAARMAPYWEKAAPHDLQSKTGRWTAIEFSRGCVRRCSYCGVRNFWGRPRYFGREKIGRYLDELVAEGFEEVFIEDDNLLSDPGEFSWITGELKRRGLWWSTPNGISAGDLEPFVDGLAGSGCWRVSLPFETGSKNTARLMGLGSKWLEIERAHRLVRELKEQGIKTCGFFIIGYPGETLDDVQMTLDYANSLPLDQRNIYIATPYPGTPLYETCREKGYLTVSPPELFRELLYTRGMIRTPEFGPEDIEAIKKTDRDAALSRRERK